MSTQRGAAFPFSVLLTFNMQSVDVTVWSCDHLPSRFCHVLIIILTPRICFPAAGEQCDARQFEPR